MTVLLREQVPVDYQDKLILSSYRRPGLTLLQSVLSLFQWHNETFNFWTHFLVLGYFFWKFQALDLPIVSDSHYWPLLSLGIGACTYPLLSSLAHAFSSMDIKTRHIVFYLDYMGISIFGCTSSMGFLAYSSPDHISNLTAYFFAYTSAVLAMMSCFLSCQSRHIPHGSSLSRLAAFSVPYLFSKCFVLFWLFYHQSSPLQHHYPHMLWDPLIGLVHASRIPERYIPLHFDVVGHSHQIFHIVVFIATNYQVDAIIQDCLLKKNAISNIELVSPLNIQILVILFVADTIIVSYHATKLFWPMLFAKKNS